MEHGYIVDLTNYECAVIAGDGFVPTGSMRMIPTSLIESATLRDNGFYYLDYNTACTVCAHAVSGDEELAERVKMACRGTFPIGVTHDEFRESITVYSVDKKSQYTITEFFRIAGSWVHSYQVQGCNMAAAFMYAIK